MASFFLNIDRFRFLQLIVLLSTFFQELEQKAENSNGTVTSTESDVKESSNDQSEKDKLEKEKPKLKVIPQLRLSHFTSKTIFFLQIYGMETTSSNEGGKKWNRPETPTTVRFFLRF